VSENKVLCHPSSVDSLSTSAGQEDHVSMGGFSARKALKVVENVEKGDFVPLTAYFLSKKSKYTYFLKIKKGVINHSL